MREIDEKKISHELTVVQAGILNIIVRSLICVLNFRNNPLIKAIHQKFSILMISGLQTNELHNDTEFNSY